MAFVLGSKTVCQEQTKPKGTYRDVAVKCWFTASGRAMPLMMKIKTEQGEIMKVENIQVVTSEKQWYTGIQTWKYRCRAEIAGQRYEFLLLFEPGRCVWKLVM